MNASIDTNTQPALRDRIGRILETVFQEWVLQLALVFAVFTTVVNSALSIDRGTIV